MATRVLVCCRTSYSGAFPPPSCVLACYWSMVVCYWSISQSQTTTQLAGIWAPLHGDQQHTGTLVVLEKYISICSLPGVILWYSESWVPMKYWGVSKFAQCEVFIQIPRLATRMKKSPKLPPRQFFFNSSYLHLECMLSILDIFICLCIGDIHHIQSGNHFSVKYFYIDNRYRAKEYCI